MNVKVLQGTSADITKRALSMLSQAIEGWNSKIIMTIHDEIVLETSNNSAEDVKNILHDTMVAAGQYYIKTVPIVVDVKIAKDWSEK
ncbi:MAG: hypothetical protein HQK99_17090 [Nitrospirae bacterium]|nr:hypothetical protein [Nitrospirota bacterium]